MNVKIKMVQGAPILGAFERNVAWAVQEIEQAIQEGVELIIFPELILTGYMVKDLTYQVARTQELFPKSILKLSHEIDIIISWIHESRMHQFFNSASYISGGELVYTHHKNYLPTYGVFDEARHFTRGEEFRAFETKFGRIGMLICEDAWHMSAVYALYQDQAEMIVVLTASPTRGVGKEETSSIVTWEHMLSTYARLVTSYIVMVGRVGYEEGLSFWGGSQVVSPEGEVEVKLPYFKVASGVHTLKLERIRQARIHSQMIKNEDISKVIRNLQRIQNDR